MAHQKKRIKHRPKARRNDPATIHDYYLNQLIWHLEEVDEDPYGIEWILRDGIWMPDNKVQRYKLCDLVCVYYDRHVAAIELKGSTKQRRKAKLQCEYGRQFANQVLGIEDVVQKAVYYKGGRYEYERFD